MSKKGFFAGQFRLLWRFLGFFQPLGLRLLHALVAALVIMQCLTGLETHAGSTYKGIVRAICTDWHVIAGLVLFAPAQALAVGSLQHRGLRTLFPYLWGDITHLREDLAATLRGKLVPPRPGGLASCVQGVGLGALLLAVYSGVAWFVAWLLDLSARKELIELHKTLVPLVGLYVLGHGGMALTHFVIWQRKTRKPAEPRA